MRDFYFGGGMRAGKRKGERERSTFFPVCPVFLLRLSVLAWIKVNSWEYLHPSSYWKALTSILHALQVLESSFCLILFSAGFPCYVNFLFLVDTLIIWLYWCFGVLIHLIWIQLFIQFLFLLFILYCETKDTLSKVLFIWFVQTQRLDIALSHTPTSIWSCVMFCDLT